MPIGLPVGEALRRVTPIPPVGLELRGEEPGASFKLDVVSAIPPRLGRRW